MNNTSSPVPEWMPETMFRDVLLGSEFLNSHHLCDRSEPLFWINVRDYMHHPHSSLNFDQLIDHWEFVYVCCCLGNRDELRAIPYVSLPEMEERLAN
jgi:hypothetical protein